MIVDGNSIQMFKLYQKYAFNVPKTMLNRLLRTRKALREMPFQGRSFSAELYKSIQEMYKKNLIVYKNT